MASRKAFTQFSLGYGLSLCLLCFKKYLLPLLDFLMPTHLAFMVFLYGPLQSIMQLSNREHYTSIGNYSLAIRTGLSLLGEWDFYSKLTSKLALDLSIKHSSFPFVLIGHVVSRYSCQICLLCVTQETCDIILYASITDASSQF